MSYQKYDRYPSYKTTFIAPEKRTNQELAYLDTGEYVFTVDHSRKQQRVYEVFSIPRYTNKVLLKLKNKNAPIDPDFSINQIYDSAQEPHESSYSK